MDLGEEQAVLLGCLALKIPNTFPMWLRMVNSQWAGLMPNKCLAALSRMSPKTDDSEHTQPSSGFHFPSLKDGCHLRRMGVVRCHNQKEEQAPAASQL